MTSVLSQARGGGGYEIYANSIFVICITWFVSLCRFDSVDASVAYEMPVSLQDMVAPWPRVIITVNHFKKVVYLALSVVSLYLFQTFSNRPNTNGKLFIK